MPTSCKLSVTSDRELANPRASMIILVMIESQGNMTVFDFSASSDAEGRRTC